MISKLCPRCGVKKELSDFHKNRTRKDGLSGFCKGCSNAANKVSITQNRDVYLQGKHKYYEAHKEEYKEYKKVYEALNRDELREHRREYRKNNSAWLSDYRKRYRANNLLRHRIDEQNRRARKNSAGGKITKKDVEIVYALQGGSCKYCKCGLGDDYHIDHFVPLARGGTNYPENIVLACAACNLRKADKTPEEFYRIVGVYGD